MKKFFASVMVALAIVVGINVVTIAPAAATTSVAVSTVSAPKQIGGGVIKPLWYTLSGSCYVAMNGGYYCYRYGCTAWERIAYNCTNGYYRVSNTWYA